MKATDTTNQSNNLRFGYVSNYDAKKHMAKVLFPDMDNLISGWLLICVPNSKDNHDERPLDINEHVACIMNSNGTENGIILGSVYDDDNSPDIGDLNIRAVTFSDGTKITYDRQNHELNINCKGDININSKSNINIISDGNIKLQAGRIDLN